MTVLVRRRVTESPDVEELTECLLLIGSLNHGELVLQVVD